MRGILLRTDPQARALPARSLDIVGIGFQALCRRVAVARKFPGIEHLRAKQPDVQRCASVLRIRQLPTVADRKDQVFPHFRIQSMTPAPLAKQSFVRQIVANRIGALRLGFLCQSILLDPPCAEMVRRTSGRLRNLHHIGLPPLC